MMTSFWRVAPLLAILLFSPLSVQAQNAEGPSKEYRELVAELIELSGMKPMVRQMSDQMMANTRPMIVAALRKDFAESGQAIDEETIQHVADRFREEFSKQLDTIYPFMADAYAPFLSLEEIAYVVKVYKTPTMRKIIKAQPKIMQNIVPIMSKWGELAGQRAMERALESADLPTNDESNL